MKKSLIFRNVFGKPVKFEGSNGGGVTKVDTLPEQGEQGKVYYNTTDGNYYVYTQNDTYVPVGIKYVDGIDMDEPIERGIIYYNTTDEAYYITNQNSNNYPVKLGRIEFNNDYQEDYEPGVIYASPSGGFYCLTDKGQYTIGDHPVFPIKVKYGDTEQGTLNVKANQLWISLFAGSQISHQVSKLLSIQLQDGPNGPYIIRFTAFIGMQLFLGCADNSTIYFSGKVPTYEVGHTYEINILGGYANIYDVTPGDPTVPVVEEGGGR